MIIDVNLFQNEPFGALLEGYTDVVESNVTLFSAKQKAEKWVKQFEAGTLETWRKVRGMNEYNARINDKVLCLSISYITTEAE